MALAQLRGPVSLAGVGDAALRGPPLQLAVVGDRLAEGRAVGRVRGEARLEHRLERGELAVAGRPRARGSLRVAVPRLGEAGEAGAAAVAVRGEHRAHPALAVRVRADDDAVVLDRVEHRALRVD